MYPTNVSVPKSSLSFVQEMLLSSVHSLDCFLLIVKTLSECLSDNLFTIKAATVAICQGNYVLTGSIIFQYPTGSLMECLILKRYLQVAELWCICKPPAPCLTFLTNSLKLRRRRHVQASNLPDPCKFSHIWFRCCLAWERLKLKN